eukprot:3941125-Rhodomonas_salina.2
MPVPDIAEQARREVRYSQYRTSRREIRSSQYRTSRRERRVHDQYRDCVVPYARSRREIAAPYAVAALCTTLVPDIEAPYVSTLH